MTIMELKMQKRLLLRNRRTYHQKENTSFTNGGDGGGGDSSEFLYQASTAFDSFKSTLGETWNDLLNSNQPKDINKKMHESKAGDVSQDDNEAADKYEGTTAMMIIDETENLTAYERIQERLKEAPIIQGEISPMSLSFRNTQ